MFSDGEHHVLRSQQSHAVGVRFSRDLLGKLGQRDVDVDPCRSNRNYSRNLLGSYCMRFENFFDKTLVNDARFRVNRVLLVRQQKLRGVPRPDNTWNSHFARNNRRMTSRPAVLCDDRAGYLHVRNPVRIRHASNKNVLLFHHTSRVLQAHHNLRPSRMKTWTSGETLNDDDTIKHGTFSRLRGGLHSSPESLRPSLDHVHLLTRL